MNKIAIITGGWYFPEHFYKNLITVIPPDGYELDFFVMSHRTPSNKIKDEMLPRIKNENKYDLELFSSIATTKKLKSLGYKVHKCENKIGDYYFFNQWGELYDYKDYEYVVFLHDDNYLLPSFQSILTDIFSFSAEFFGHNGDTWVKASPNNFDYIANSCVGNRKTARGSFSIWSKQLLMELGGQFPMQGVEVTRSGLTDTPTEHSTLDWNTVGTNFSGWVEKSGFQNTSYRLSLYYRVSKYMIEAERGLISNHTVTLNYFDGLKALKLT